MNYHQTYQASRENSDSFWLEKANIIHWYTKPSQAVINTDDANYQWFPDGKLNTSYLALDYHVEQGRGEQVALIYDSPVTQTQRTFTYGELTDLVAKFADVLQKKGVEKGDRILIYMPMIPQAAIAMLACARLGAIHSVVFGGFAAHELAVRIDDARPKVIVSASCGVECDKIIPYKPLIDLAIAEAKHSIEACIIYQRVSNTCKHVISAMNPSQDYDWQSLMADATPIAPVVLNATDPLYILYTSGTTGKPKGVVRDNGGHAVALKYSMKAIYGVDAGDVFWAASDVGWVVGHSYIVYAPLLAGCTTILYEGKPIKTPDAGAFWRVCQQYNVKALFSAPTAFRAICKEDPNADFLSKYPMPHLERLFLAGERLDPATYHWLKEKTNRPVIDHWWQTETGWAIAGIPVGIESLTTKAGSAGVPTPGYNVKILDEHGKTLPKGEQGSIAIKLPLPPGCLATIWQNPERFKAGYLKTYPGYYLTGDGGYIDNEGYLFIMGRTDDVINVAGHRLSTGEMEEVIANYAPVAECAVVGVNDALKGQMPFALVVLKNGVQLAQEKIIEQVKLLIREKIGAIASLKNVMIVERLPKTRSGKIVRKVIRQMLDGDEYQVPSTIDDTKVLDELLAQILANKP